MEIFKYLLDEVHNQLIKLNWTQAVPEDLA